MTLARRLLALGLVALTLGACADRGTPLAPLPAGGPALATAPSAPSVSRLATYRPGHRPSPAHAAAWIGAAGGRLELQGFAIVVPAGAVDRRTRFSIRLPVSGRKAEPVLADFGPHGKRFAVPVTIELPYAGTSIEGVPGSVLRWDRRTRQWVDAGGSVSADGTTLSARVRHFSLYGAAASRSGGVTTSGG